jgi:hypothetical protein
MAQRHGRIRACSSSGGQSEAPGQAGLPSGWNSAAFSPSGPMRKSLFVILLAYYPLTLLAASETRPVQFRQGHLAIPTYTFSRAETVPPLGGHIWPMEQAGWREIFTRTKVSNLPLNERQGCYFTIKTVQCRHMWLGLWPLRTTPRLRMLRPFCIPDL